MDKQNCSNEQLEYAEKFVENTDAHIFLTGKAGTGKTTFLRNLSTHTNKRLVVVAPTGVAAINAGGVTIHSFFQLPFGPQIPDSDEADLPGTEKNIRAMASRYQKMTGVKLKIIRSLDLLVIDEISMVRADVLDAIDNVLRRTRRNNKPFGGVQLLMIGDVHQLAPVAKPDEWELLSPYYESVYFFNSRVWQRTSYICIELQHIYRQQDIDFIVLLNKIRNNIFDNEVRTTLNQYYRPDFKPADKDGYITLTTHNSQADAINNKKLEALKGKKITCKAVIEGIFQESAYPTQTELILKKGAQVMFVKNDPTPEKRYYNGKIGVVDGIDDNDNVVVRCDKNLITVEPVKWQNFEYSIDAQTKDITETEIGSFTQTPLKLAWAVTIHKSQGLTFDKVIVDANQAFAHGQVYVALSRCTSLEGLVLRSPITDSGLRSDYDVSKFIGSMSQLEPSDEKFIKLKTDFERRMLLDFFNCDDLEFNLNRIRKIVITYNTLFEKSVLEQLNNKCLRMQTEVVEIEHKFENQIDRLYASNTSNVDNEVLNERIDKGLHYFSEHLFDIVDVSNLELSTENQAVNVQLREVVSQLCNAVFIKKACFEACADGFDVQKYLKVKNVKSVEVEETKRSPRGLLERKTTKLSDKPLFNALLNWRLEIAESLGASIAKILTRNQLIEIASNKPTRLESLLNIKGIGKTKSKRFGQEIINIVRGFMQQSPTETIENELIDDNATNLNTFERTKQLFDQGYDINEIAKQRGLSRNTIENHLMKYIQEGLIDPSSLVSDDKIKLISDYFIEVEDPALKSAKEVLGDDVSYFEIKVALAKLRADNIVNF